MINPVTKFGLCSRPLNLTLETVLGIAETPSLNARGPHGETLVPPNTNADEAVLIDHDDGEVGSTKKLADEADDTEPEMSPAEKRKLGARVISRTVVTAACTAAAIYLPAFGTIMALLGSFSAFLICIILPVSPVFLTSPICRLVDILDCRNIDSLICWLTL